VTRYHEQLHIHALNDLTNRAKSGLLVYLCTWFILSFNYKFNIHHPDFFIFNSCILVAIMLSRFSHYVVFVKQRYSNVQFMHQWLVASILLSGIHWGGMAAWVFHNPELDYLRHIMLIITPAFALGAACTLSISTEIRMLYPTLMLAPLITILINQGDTEGVTFAMLTSICLMYIFSASKASHNDYWAAITNHLVAEERAELMEKLSTTDTLTQLNNRMFFDTEYTKEWKRCSRINCPLSILMLDLDFFKELNDTYGHLFGDECLRKVANVIKNEVARPTDCVSRYGGEEFIVLLPNTNQKGTSKIANKMLLAVSSLQLECDGVKVSLTCSIGGASAIPDFKKARANLIKQADTALYYAKNQGRNRYTYFQDTLE